MSSREWTAWLYDCFREEESLATRTSNIATHIPSFVKSINLMYLVKNSAAMEFSDEASFSSKVILALNSWAVIIRSRSSGKMTPMRHGHLTGMSVDIPPPFLMTHTQKDEQRNAHEFIVYKYWFSCWFISYLWRCHLARACASG